MRFDPPRVFSRRGRLQRKGVAPHPSLPRLGDRRGLSSQGHPPGSLDAPAGPSLLPSPGLPLPRTPVPAPAARILPLGCSPRGPSLLALGAAPAPELPGGVRTHAAHLSGRWDPTPAWPRRVFTRDGSQSRDQESLYHACAFPVVVKTHNIKFTLLTVFRCAVQGPQVHSHCRVTTPTVISRTFRLPKLRLCPPLNTNPPLPLAYIIPSLLND